MITLTKSKQTKPNKTKQGVQFVVADLIAALILLVAVAVCFGRTLESYFLADDLGEISYVSSIFNGQPELFWTNFTGNYMQIPSMAVWRPWLLVTLVVDFLVWKTNAFGYYLTNLAYYAGAIALVYAVMRTLTRPWAKWQSIAGSFFGALLFAVNPLHCESVSWVVGRVDIACCFYYLLAFYLFVGPKRSVYSLAFGTLSFWLALWTKEMAIGLPVVISATSFFLSPTINLSFFGRTKEAIAKAWPLWLSILIYFPLRYLCLGTITGGYTGSIGASQFGQLVSRWLDPDTISRFFYPLNYSLFQQNSIYHHVIGTAYLLAFALVVARLLTGQLSVKWSAFLALWTATCAVPIYQLWGLGYDLEGSRFYFFLTLATSFVLPILLFCPSNSNQSKIAKRWSSIFSACVLALLIFGFAKACIATNLIWVHAGKEVKAVFNQSISLAQSTDSKVILLGLPKRNSGAHMILNGETFRIMLSPPFTNELLSSKFLTFEPVLFGNSDVFDVQRFRSLVGTTKAYVWATNQKQFQPISLPNENKSIIEKALPLSMQSTIQPYSYNHAVYQLTKSSNLSLKISNLQTGDGIRIPNLSFSPLDFDYLALDAKTSNTAILFKLGWQPRFEESAKLFDYVVKNSNPDHFQTIYIPLSRYWSWFAQPTIEQLVLLLPAADIEIKNLKLVKSSEVAPKIALTEIAASNTGVYTMNADMNNLTQLNFVLHSLPKLAGTRLQLQISKADFFFDNFADDQTNEIVGKSIIIDDIGAHKTIPLKTSLLDKPAYYQIRAVCLDKQGRQLGCPSNVITIHRLNDYQDLRLSRKNKTIQPSLRKFQIVAACGEYNQTL